MNPHNGCRTTIPDTGFRLFLLRHGETARPELFHGSESDIALGERGRAQAEAAAIWLRSQAPEAIYCSTMLRARQTAEILAGALGLEPPTIVEDLHERKMAALSGQPKAEGWPIYVQVRDRWIAGDLDATHEGAESYREIAERVVPRLTAIAGCHAGEAVVLVAHGVVIRVLLTQMLDGASPADWERFGIDCAAVNALDFDGQRWTAWMLNGREIAIGSDLRNLELDPW